MFLCSHGHNIKLVIVVLLFYSVIEVSKTVFVWEMLSLAGNGDESVCIFTKWKMIDINKLDMMIMMHIPYQYVNELTMSHIAYRFEALNICDRCVSVQHCKVFHLENIYAFLMLDSIVAHRIVWELTKSSWSVKLARPISLFPLAYCSSMLNAR